MELDPGANPSGDAASCRASPERIARSAPRVAPVPRTAPRLPAPLHRRRCRPSRRPARGPRRNRRCLRGIGDVGVTRRDRRRDRRRVLLRGRRHCGAVRDQEEREQQRRDHLPRVRARRAVPSFCFSAFSDRTASVATRIGMVQEHAVGRRGHGGPLFSTDCAIELSIGARECPRSASVCRRGSSGERPQSALAARLPARAHPSRRKSRESGCPEPARCLSLPRGGRAVRPSDRSRRLRPRAHDSGEQKISWTPEIESTRTFRCGESRSCVASSLRSFKRSQALASPSSRRSTKEGLRVLRSLASTRASARSLMGGGAGPQPETKQSDGLCSMKP